MTTVELPDKVLKALKEKMEREGKSLEEVIGEATWNSAASKIRRLKLNST